MKTLAVSPSRARTAALVALLALVVGCEGNGPASPGGPYPASLSLSVALQAATGGGEAEAYNACNIIHVHLSGASATPFDEVFPFTPRAVTHVPVAIMVSGQSQAVLSVTLLRGALPVFTGSATVTLVPNGITAANLTLVPVAAGISVPDTLPPLAAIGQTSELPGDVLFATGDVATSLHLTWTSLTPQIVGVQTSGTTSSVLALAQGLGQLKASYGSFSQDVGVRVHIVATSVEVSPGTASINGGQTIQLSFVARDARGNAIDGAVATWSSSNDSVASVDETGLVTGLGTGTATISAEVDDAVGQATVSVVALPPVPQTLGAANVFVRQADLQATVNPKSTPTTAWFEWGTDPTLSSPTQTPPESVGSGSTNQSVSATITGLQPETTYYFRVVASNGGGTERGAIRTLTTLTPAAPVVTVTSPTNVSATGATLWGSVNPKGSATTAWFEWGADPTLAEYTATPMQDVTVGLTAVQIARSISGLTIETTYYVRLVANNEGGTSKSSIYKFETVPRAPSGLAGTFDGPLYMNWTDNSSNETKFQVEEATSSSGPFTVSGTAPANTPYASENPPFPARIVYHRVRACNTWGCSDPSNVIMNTADNPRIAGSLYGCYDSGTQNCSIYVSGVTVTLTGGVSQTTTSGTYGDYSFNSLPVGTYRVQVPDSVCSTSPGEIFRKPTQTVTVGWGETGTVDFLADTTACGVPIAARSTPFDPAVAAFLGIDADPAPR